MTALVLVDMQNDYFPGGRMELHGADLAVGNAANLLTHFRHHDWPVVHVQHVATEPDATFFLPATPGVEIHRLVAPVAGEPVVVKHHPNAFLDTDLYDHLAVGDGSLVIVGMMTHMCVDSTTRAASDLGFACAVVADACATRDLSDGVQTVGARQVHAAFLAALHGTFAQVESTAAVLARLA